MPMSLFIRHLALGLLAAAAAEPASAAAVHCPSELHVQQTAAELPAGLTVFDSEPRHLWTNVQFSEGPPADQAWLAPDTTNQRGHIVTNVWRLQPSVAGTFVSCFYSGTSLATAFRLADGIRRCEVRYDAAVSPLTATAIDCR